MAKGWIIFLSFAVTIIATTIIKSIWASSIDDSDPMAASHIRDFRNIFGVAGSIATVSAFVYFMTAGRRG